MRFIKTLTRLFRVKTDLELAHMELAEARRELLGACSAVDYARSVVEYNKMRISRLADYIKVNGGAV